jgi:hypothetical protein
MNRYARGVLAILLGGFGLVALRTGLEGLFGPYGFSTGASAAALPEALPPLAVAIIGLVSLIWAVALVRQLRRRWNEGDPL